MQFPQLVIHEEDGALARALRPRVESGAPRWAVREPRRLDSCLRLLRRGHPSVLLLRAGRDVVREMTLLERVGAQCPDAGVVVIATAASPALAGLAWHLGAGYVFTTEPSLEALHGVIVGLMERSSEQCRSGAARARSSPEDLAELPSSEGDADA